MTWIHRENKLSSPAIEKSLLRNTDLGQNSYLKKEKLPLVDVILTVITSGLLEAVVKMANIQQSLFFQTIPMSKW